jgi:signal transduction histidine kinase/FixJ family two-component response regulator
MSNTVEEKLAQKSVILIVDDEQIILNIASDVLIGEGYTIETSQNPLEALERIKNEKFDFLLTDIKMPHMDGMTLAKEAQKVDSNLGTIFMTGYASLDTAKEAIKAGAYDYIMKPFELAELRRGVAKAVEKKAKMAEGAGGQDLKRLSDLMEVLYNVGDRDSLLKLSLGLALLNCNLDIGMIASWDQRSSSIELAATNNVKEGSFNVISHFMNDEDAEKCFDIESNSKNVGISDNPFFKKLKKNIPQISKFADCFNDEGKIATLAVKTRKQFYIALILQESEEEPLNDRDMKLLSIVLSLISLAAENITLFEESQKALSELEKLHDDIVNLEKVAAKGLMSAEIGHEMNNFLNIIRSNFELMNFKADISNQDEIIKYTENINNSLDQMTRFSKGLADAANMRTEKQQMSLNSLIDDIVAFMSPQKRFRDIAMAKNLDESLPNIEADPSQLTQLFYNILNNDAQALTGRENSEIKIITKYNDYEKEVLIEILDNGPGFPEEKLEKAFDSRFTTKSDGHGFGLMVCSKVVGNHGGKISVDRVKPNGTVFSIIIPVFNKQNPAVVSSDPNASTTKIKL